MLIGVPDPEDLNSVALRLYFNSWSRILTIISNFGEHFGVQISALKLGNQSYEEWIEYSSHAQPELGAICAMAQQSAEIRLKSIICQTSPYLLLANGQTSLNSKNIDIEFSDQRTLDAVDLPKAVRMLTNFKLPDAYVQQYAIMRRLRNQIMHLGKHNEELTLRRLVKILAHQYIALWPDGRWLFRRTRYDGQTTEQYFHDGRWSSVESSVMAELPLTIELLENVNFKKMFGIGKSKIDGYCPSCMYGRASKWDVEGHVTAYRNGYEEAICLMCEESMYLRTSKKCQSCGSMLDACMKKESNMRGSFCFKCGHDERKFVRQNKS